MLPAGLVKLPSQGKLYNNSPLYSKEHVEYKGMITFHEDILINPSYTKQNKNFDELIKNCLYLDFNPSDLIIADKNSLLIAIRTSGYGGEIHLPYNCEECNGRNDDWRINLSNLSIRFLTLNPIVEGENKFLFVLPKSKKKVIFKFLTFKDEKFLNSQEKEGWIRKFLYSSILEIDGVSDCQQILKFIDNMSAMDSLLFREFVDEHEPKVFTQVSHKCVHCEKKIQDDLMNGLLFGQFKPEDREDIILQPFFLLSYYAGISWETYYNWPIPYKRWYIERLQQEINKRADNGQVPSKHVSQNNPQTRELLGISHPNAPHSLKRF